MFAPQCPTCFLDVPTVVSTHRTAAGEIRYRRCVCGRWVVETAGTVVAAAGGSTFGVDHREPAAVDQPVIS